MKFKEYDTVRIMKDCEEGIKKGEIGTILMAFWGPREAYEIEILDDKGNLKHCTLLPDDLELINKAIIEWKKIETEQDILEIQKIYENFLDAEIVSFRFDSGNFVDEELVGHEYMKNIFSMIFQRMDNNPFSIEVVFEEMRRINFYAPLIDEYSAEILFAKFVKNDDFIYWTKWRDFNPYNPEHLKEDTTFVEAKRVKWRIIS